MNTNNLMVRFLKLRNIEITSYAIAATLLVGQILTPGSTVTLSSAVMALVGAIVGIMAVCCLTPVTAGLFLLFGTGHSEIINDNSDFIIIDNSCASENQVTTLVPQSGGPAINRRQNDPDLAA